MVSRAQRARNVSCYLDRSLRFRVADTFKQECLGEIDGRKTKTNTRGTGKLAPRPPFPLLSLPEAVRPDPRLPSGYH